jgi:hypothetical protein
MSTPGISPVTPREEKRMNVMQADDFKIEAYGTVTKPLYASGSSDDLIHVGFGDEVEEFNLGARDHEFFRVWWGPDTPDETADMAEFLVYVGYVGPLGTWAVGIAPVEEDLPMPEGIQAHFRAAANGYSSLLTVQVPPEARFEKWDG